MKGDIIVKRLMQDGVNRRYSFCPSWLHLNQVDRSPTSAVPVKEEMIDDFNWKIKGREVGVIWRYTLWKCTDSTGNIHWVETSRGTLNLYFFSIPLIGEERALSISPDPV